MTESTVRITSHIPEVVKVLNATQMKALKTSIGLRLQKALKERIVQGDTSWARLSPEWVEKKGHANPWYYTGQMGKAIEYEINDAGVRVGVLKHDTYPETGENVASVAAKLEYGTTIIPARPLLEPVFQEEIKGIVADAAKDIAARVKKASI